VPTANYRFLAIEAVGYTPTVLSSCFIAIDVGG